MSSDCQEFHHLRGLTPRIVLEGPDPMAQCWGARMRWARDGSGGNGVIRNRYVWVQLE
jgi:hypothetical protein